MKQHGAMPDQIAWYLYLKFGLIARNGILSAYAQKGEANKASELFQQMRDEGVVPDVENWYCT